MSADSKHSDSIHVEVAYALPDKQAIVPLQVAQGTTAIDAVRRAGLDRQFEGLDIDNAKLGIFGKVVGPQQALREGDRVEVYRPLIADPKEVRKARAARVKERRKGDAPA
ncbi:RnfH family protein [Parahaliea mediterranea]|uniref:RnfH family protein n=1 Tax=Parahaliea mediterranea TaxID=651086 RepID=UPI001F4D9B63|nr:RnfH family protein [Parahaliea mediterranea]